MTLTELKLAFPLGSKVQLNPGSQRFAGTLGEKGTVAGHSQGRDLDENAVFSLILRIDGRKGKHISQPSQWERSP